MGYCHRIVNTIALVCATLRVERSEAAELRQRLRDQRRAQAAPEPQQPEAAAEELEAGGEERAWPALQATEAAGTRDRWAELLQGEIAEVNAIEQCILGGARPRNHSAPSEGLGAEMDDLDTGGAIDVDSLRMQQHHQLAGGLKLGNDDEYNAFRVFGEDEGDDDDDEFDLLAAESATTGSSASASSSGLFVDERGAAAASAADDDDDDDDLDDDLQDDLDTEAAAAAASRLGQLSLAACAKDNFDPFQQDGAAPPPLPPPLPAQDDAFADSGGSSRGDGRGGGGEQGLKDSWAPDFTDDDAEL
jgi:hypothetical protein